MQKSCYWVILGLMFLPWGSSPSFAGNGKEHLQPVFHLLFANTPHVSVTKSIFSPDEQVVVKLTNMPGNDEDWVGIYPKGSTNAWENVIAWKFTHGIRNGELAVSTMVRDLNPGLYEARVFFNNTFVLEAECSFIVHSSSLVPMPVYSDAAGLPELGGDTYGAMGEHPVRKITIANPWPAYANKDYLKVDLYLPADVTGKRPTVFFITGYSMYHSESYYSLLYFIASKGYNCVFVPHENTNPDFHPELLLTILDNVVEQFSPIIDTTRVGYVGHSEGGGLIFYLAKDRPQWGTNGRFLFSLAAWWGFNLPETGDVDYPPGTNMIIQMGNPALDKGTDPRQNVDFLLHNNIPVERKTYLYLPGDANHPATHRLSYSSEIDIGGQPNPNGIAYYNALQQVGLFRPLESLMHYSFGDDNPQWKKIGLPDAGDANYNTLYALNGITVLSTDDPFGNHDIPIPLEKYLTTNDLCHQHDPLGYYNPRWRMCMPCGDTARDVPWQQCN
jgi:pimeloyl-ACP methyl ester carboxylesterase